MLGVFRIKDTDEKLFTTHGCDTSRRIPQKRNLWNLENQMPNVPDIPLKRDTKRQRYMSAVVIDFPARCHTCNRRVDKQSGYLDLLEAEGVPAGRV